MSRFPLRKGLLGTCLVAASLSAMATPASAYVTGPSGLSFYSPPSWMTSGPAGSIVWARPIVPLDPAHPELTDPVFHKDAGSATRVIFRSRAIDGSEGVQSASVLIPKGSVPAGGWKIVSWNHVTTGGADDCAPSRATPSNTEFERLMRSDDVVGGLLRAKIAVVRPDYEGIGTAGPHPYLIGRSLARSNTDGVRAARELVPAIGTKWAVAGQSEGGIAAMFTSSLASTLAPELQLQATLAATPPVDNKTLVFGVVPWVPIAGNAVTPLAALMVSGAATADPNLAAGLQSGALSTEGAVRFRDLETRCLADLGAWSSLAGLSQSQLFGPTVDQYRESFFAELDANDPRTVRLGTEPVRIYAGSLDGVAWQSKINDVVDIQRARGANVSYKTYALGTHVNITDDWVGGRDMWEWLTARLS